MADGLNEARAMRVAEVMNDFRTLQYYIAQFDADSSDEDYYEEGYEVLRECISQALVVLAALYDTSTLQSSGSGGEPERRQLQRILIDASARRFQAQRIYLRGLAATTWVQMREAILQGQRANADHMPALQQVSNNLRAELATITNERVLNDLRTKDWQAGHWLDEDPSLQTMLQWIRRAQR